jgi:hypothetical protein
MVERRLASKVSETHLEEVNTEGGTDFSEVRTEQFDDESCFWIESTFRLGRTRRRW